MRNKPVCSKQHERITLLKRSITLTPSSDGIPDNDPLCSNRPLPPKDIPTRDFVSFTKATSRCRKNTLPTSVARLQHGCTVPRPLQPLLNASERTLRCATNIAANKYHRYNRLSRFRLHRVILGHCKHRVIVAARSEREGYCCLAPNTWA
jgi:hypothetical protein